MNLRNLFRRPVAAVAVSVEGERGRIPSVNQARSIQSRLATFLILGLVGAFCLAIATWYYVTQIGKLGNVERDQKAALAKRVSGDQKLRPLGAVAPPVPAKPASAAPAVGLANAVYGSTAPPLTTPATTGQQATPGTANAVTPPASTPREIERAFLLQRSKTAQDTTRVAQNVTSVGTETLGVKSGDSASVRLLADRQLLATKGTLVDCTLRTAIDSTLPGMVLCVGAEKVYSDDGSKSLLPPGTKYIGETRGEARQGQARIGIIWTEATTPNGCRVVVNSPGTDSLGRAGLEGWVDTHFWDRFGAAVMLSLIDSSVAALAAAQGGGGTAIAINPSSGGTVAAEALKGTVSIPPTIRVAQGERIQILLRQDIPFTEECLGLRAAR